MTTIKDTAVKTTVGLASLSLVAKSGKMLKDSLKVKSTKNQTKNLVKGTVDLTVGVGLLGALSDVANSN